MDRASAVPEVCQRRVSLELLQMKVVGLEHLVRLKDLRIAELTARGDTSQ